MTKTGSWLPIEEVNQLRALTVGEPSDCLRLADAAGVQEARRFHAPELGNGHQDVDHLRGGDIFGRRAEDRLDAETTVLAILLELRPPDSDVIRTSQCVHPLVQRSDRSVCLRFCR